jgi:UMF1 family MFS transporter
MRNRKTQNAWAFYDWANSVYSLVISTAVFPIYFESATVAQGREMVTILGFEARNTVIYSYSLSLSFLLVAIMSPLLSGIADYTGKKKRFLQFFCYLGAISCSGLFFFYGRNIYYGLGLSVLASIGFWGSLVFYNAFLPEVAKPEEQDRLSARGFALGYAGAALLLILNLMMIQMPDVFGLADSGAASRWSFLMVGIWWAGFAQISFRRLPDNPYHRKPGKRWFLKGYEELLKVGRHMRKLKSLRRFLYSFFMYSIGVQTVMYLASLFGKTELGLETSTLIMTILIIQFVGIAGSFLFSFIARKLGNLQALKISIVIWAFICYFAYTMSATDPNVVYKFYFIGGMVGLVMGGIQAISRSTFSKMLPKTHSHASFFSFYDVSEKIAIVAGTLVYGYLIHITGSMKMSALALSIFFIAALILIYRVKKTKYVR